MSARGGFTANRVSSRNDNPIEEWKPRVTAVDTFHSDSARRGVAARPIEDEVILNSRMASTRGRRRGARCRRRLPDQVTVRRVRVFVVMSEDRVTILSVRCCSRACLGGGVRVAFDRRLSSRETLHVFPDADSFFFASQISTRARPRKPHEMAQQVPTAVIPAGLEAEKRDKLASVYQAMTDKETNTPQVCFHVLLAFGWDSEPVKEYLNGTPQQREGMVLPAGLQGGNQGENPTLESVVTAGALTVADFPVSDVPYDDHANSPRWSCSRS